MFGKLFRSSKPAPAKQGSEVSALAAAFAEYVIAPSSEEIEQALDGWSWLDLPDTQPIIVTAFGDMLFERDDHVVMLDTLEGGLLPVARSVADLRKRLSDIELQDHVFSAVWVQAARRRGLSLTPETCFDWRIAPALGGAFDPDNIETQLFVVKVHLAGQIHQQIRSLPPGTTINKVTISE